MHKPEELFDKVTQRISSLRNTSEVMKMQYVNQEISASVVRRERTDKYDFAKQYRDVACELNMLQSCMDCCQKCCCVCLESIYCGCQNSMSSTRGYRRNKPEEPDWRTRENRGHSWFTNMKREKDKKKSGMFE